MGGTDATKTAQWQAILAWMEEGRRITPIDALHLFGCFRLGARIKDIEDRGHRVNRRMVTAKNKIGETKHFMEYWIEQ